MYQQEVGRSFASFGDVNGDGVDDLVITSRGDSRNKGAVHVIFGSDSGFPASFDISDLNGANGFTLSKIDDDDSAGSNARSVGDVNGDGFGDIYFSAPLADVDGTIDGGEGYIVFGDPRGYGGVALSFFAQGFAQATGGSAFTRSRTFKI